MKHKLSFLLLAVMSAAVALQTSCKKVEPTAPVLEKISMSASNLEMTEGDELVLTVSLTPGDIQGVKLVWESGDESIAMVNQSGKITALKEGQTQINVSAPAYNKSATCKVNVKKKIVEAGSIELNHSSLEMKIGDEKTLVATVKPEETTDKTIVWSSDHPEIAKVENGMVTALAPGKAVITARSGDKTATCAVTVDIISITGMKIVTADNKTKFEIGETGKCMVEIQPENATCQDVVWKSEQPEIVSIDEKGGIKALKAGTATITASVEEGENVIKCDIRLEVLSDLVISNYTNLKYVYWGINKTFTAADRKSGAARDVEWSIVYQGTDNLLNVKIRIDKVTGELSPAATVIDGKPVYENFKFKVIATAKDNGSTAEKELECIWWKAVPSNSQGGNEVASDYIFKRGDNVWLSFNTGLGAMMQQEEIRKMSISYDSNKLRHYADEIWKLTVKTDAPQGPEEITLTCGKHQQKLSIYIESLTKETFRIVSPVESAYWGENIQLDVQGGTAVKWEVFVPKSIGGKPFKTHASVIDEKGNLSIGEYMFIKTRPGGGSPKSTLYEDYKVSVTAHSKDGSTATAEILCKFWKPEVFCDGQVRDPETYEFYTGDLLKIMVKDSNGYVSDKDLSQWSVSSGDCFIRTNENVFPAVLEQQESGSSSLIYVRHGNLQQTIDVKNTFL